MHERAREFAECARERHGFDPAVEEFPDGTRTAAEAADAIGCPVAAIASGIVLRAGTGLVVVVTSGANHVDEVEVATLEDVAADDVSMADPDAVRETLGWSIGGVPPFCHDTAVPVYVDESLLQFESVWAAAGTPEAVFPIAPDELLAITGAEAVDVAE